MGTNGYRHRVIYSAPYTVKFSGANLIPLYVPFTNGSVEYAVISVRLDAGTELAVWPDSLSSRSFASDGVYDGLVVRGAAAMALIPAWSDVSQFLSIQLTGTGTAEIAIQFRSLVTDFFPQEESQPQPVVNEFAQAGVARGELPLPSKMPTPLGGGYVKTTKIS